jgi:trk system potassium uptake protein TrkH
MHPSAVHPVKIGGDVVPPNILFAVLAFGFMYMVCIARMTCCSHSPGWRSSPPSRRSSPASTTPAGIGPGRAGEQLRGLTDFQIRLEIFTLLVVMTPAFWRNDTFLRAPAQGADRRTRRSG